MGTLVKKNLEVLHYRQGLVEEREAILEFPGEDFLALEELKMVLSGFSPACESFAKKCTNQ